MTRMSDATAIRTEFPARREGLAPAFGGRARTEPKPVLALLIAASSELTVSGDSLGGLMLQRIFQQVWENCQLKSFRSLQGPLDGLVHHR